MTLKIVMLNQPCDRCAKVVPEAHPFKLSDHIFFRAKRIDWPWLCPKCYIKEKEKWWKARRDG